LRGEVHDGRHAREVLHQHARGAESDLLLGLAAVVEPGGDRLDVGLGDGAAVLVAQEVLEQHLHRERQARDVREAVLLGVEDRVHGVGLVPDGEGRAAFETVERCHGGILASGWIEHICSAECAKMRAPPRERPDDGTCARNGLDVPRRTAQPSAI
jgi:hypothetical protein